MVKTFVKLFVNVSISFGLVIAAFLFSLQAAGFLWKMLQFKALFFSQPLEFALSVILFMFLFSFLFGIVAYKLFFKKINEYIEKKF